MVAGPFRWMFEPSVPLVSRVSTNDAPMICMAARVATRSPSFSCSFILRTLIKRPGINFPSATERLAISIIQGKYWAALISRVTAKSSANCIPSTLSPNTLRRYASSLMKAPWSRCCCSQSRSARYSGFISRTCCSKVENWLALAAFSLISCGVPYFATTARKSSTTWVSGFVRTALISSSRS